MNYFKVDNKNLKEYDIRIDEVKLKESYKNNNLIRLYDYDNLFKDNIRHNGYDFYYKKTFSDFFKDGNKYTAIANGTNQYNVLIEFDDGNQMKTSSCTCPYYLENNENCKHIYALIIEISNKYTRSKLINMIQKELNDIKKYKNDLNIDCYISIINDVEEKYKFEINTDYLLKYYERIKDINRILKNIEEGFDKKIAGSVYFNIKPIKRKNGTIKINLV